MAPFFQALAVEVLINVVYAGTTLNDGKVKNDKRLDNVIQEISTKNTGCQFVY